MDYYQGNEKCRVAVLSVLAAGCGLTLTKATAVVFAELYWNPGMLLQAEDRAHRIGQKCSINVHYLVAKDSIDDLIWQKLERKLNVLGNALNGTASKMDLEQEDEEREEQFSSMDKSIFGELLDDNDAFINQIIDSVDTTAVEERHEQRLQRRALIQAVRMGAPLPTPPALEAAAATPQATAPPVEKRSVPASTTNVGVSRLAAMQYKPRRNSGAKTSSPATPASDILSEPPRRKSPLHASEDVSDSGTGVIPQTNAPGNGAAPTSPCSPPEGSQKLMALKYQPRKRRKAFVE